MVLNFLKGFNVNGRIKPTNFQSKIERGEKLHTIRVDKHGRWKTMMKIHFSTGHRSSNYNCFKEGVCKGVQFIVIENRDVYIGTRKLSEDEIEYLLNEGIKKFITPKRHHLVSITETAYPVRIKY